MINPTLRRFSLPLAALASLASTLAAHAAQLFRRAALSVLMAHAAAQYLSLPIGLTVVSKP